MGGSKTSLVTNTILQGHVIDKLREIPDESIDCVITSPPYFGLRDYKLPPVIWDSSDGCTHEWGDKKDAGGRMGREWNTVTRTVSADSPSARYDSVFSKGDSGQFCLHCPAWRGSLGLEPTYQLYIQHLMQVFREVKRVMKRTGTLWVNIGSSYNSEDIFNVEEEWYGEMDKILSRKNCKHEWKWLIKNQHRKCSLCGLNQKGHTIQRKTDLAIPERFAVAMVDDSWILRNRICWFKPNTMPSSAQDRFTMDWESVFFFTKSQRYWFKRQFEPHTRLWDETNGGSMATGRMVESGGAMGFKSKDKYPLPNPLGRNKRCVWTIPTEPYSDAHFATFPQALVIPMIQAGCPEHICTKCGKAREKIYKQEYIPAHGVSRKQIDVNNVSTTSVFRTNLTPLYEQDGMTNCNCSAPFRPGIVLDPFAGSGTTLAVAERLGRKWIGIEINSSYITMAYKRISEYETPLLKEANNGE